MVIDLFRVMCSLRVPLRLAVYMTLKTGGNEQAKLNSSSFHFPALWESTNFLVFSVIRSEFRSYSRLTEEYIHLSGYRLADSGQRETWRLADNG